MPHTPPTATPTAPPAPNRRTLPRPGRPACPRCQGRVKRVQRGWWDRLLPSRRAAKRYHCRVADCGWHGLLRREQGLWQSPTPPSPTRRWAGVALTAAVLGTALAQGLPMLLALWPSGPTAAAGISHDGEPLPAQHPLALAAAAAAAPVAASAASGAAAHQGTPTNIPPSAPTAAGLTLRQNCAWGQPGRNPYRGTPEQALTAARLPVEVVQQIAADIREGRVADRLNITRDGIRNASGSRQFLPSPFVMTYGHTLCLNARVNFAPGHSEPARLFEATDARGRRYAVMVPEVCGNVSVIGESGGNRRVALAAGVPFSREAGDGNTVISAEDAGPVNAVPLPGTLSLVLGGLAAALLFRRRG